jgi:DNA-binding MarR family transcriptional regulator
MENEKVVELRKLSQKFTYTSIQMHETIARNAGFSSTDHKYLGFFLQKGNLTAGELADLTGLTTGAVTGLIDRFEKKKTGQKAV